jgi:hypothetical protein
MVTFLNQFTTTSSLPWDSSWILKYRCVGVATHDFENESWLPMSGAVLSAISMSALAAYRSA